MVRVSPSALSTPRLSNDSEASSGSECDERAERRMGGGRSVESVCIVELLNRFSGFERPVDGMDGERAPTSDSENRFDEGMLLPT